MGIQFRAPPLRLKNSCTFTKESHTRMKHPAHISRHSLSNGLPYRTPHSPRESRIPIYNCGFRGTKIQFITNLQIPPDLRVKVLILQVHNFPFIINFYHRTIDLHNDFTKSSPISCSISDKTYKQFSKIYMTSFPNLFINFY